MVAEGALEDLADLAGLQLEGDLVELLDHGAALEPAQVAALDGAAGILRVLLSQLGEIGALLDLRQQRVGLLLGQGVAIRLLLARGRLGPLGLFVWLDEDVAGLDLGVAVLKLVVGQRDALLHGLLELVLGDLLLDPVSVLADLAAQLGLELVQSLVLLLEVPLERSLVREARVDGLLDLIVNLLADVRAGDLDVFALGGLAHEDAVNEAVEQAALGPAFLRGVALAHVLARGQVEVKERAGDLLAVDDRHDGRGAAAPPLLRAATTRGTAEGVVGAGHEDDDDDVEDGFGQAGQVYVSLTDLGFDALAEDLAHANNGHYCAPTLRRSRGALPSPAFVLTDNRLPRGFVPGPRTGLPPLATSGRQGQRTGKGKQSRPVPALPPLYLRRRWLTRRA
ncbi:MAG: hypothetical protein BWY87_01347 [Deltaproteobacteria bacterium ADurb.Bin510]|nr:MAG: hypothetical protein BWY87_01347 [Deltaproteobacteria bacterium ADurb.Bin510]